AVLVLLVCLPGCRDTKTVNFLWPELEDQYIETTRQWTRTGSIHSGFETEVIVHATYKSEDWLKAYSLKNAQVFARTAQEQEDTNKTLFRAEGKESEFFLSIYSPKNEQAKLKFNDSLWSIFVLEADQKVYPIEIRPVKEPLGRIQVFFPHVRQWHNNYILRFPGELGNSFSMIMTGPLGRIELDW
ncbi:MAG: hypothetical protein ABR542_07175, partial [Desulfonatronovibrio sp.]